MNTTRTVMLMTLLTLLLIFAGSLIGGRQGAIFAFVFAGVMNFSTYWFSDKIVLRMYRAKEVTEREAPELYALVRRLAQQGQLPMPKVYITPQQTPNAFATGRNPQHAAVAVTRGILTLLTTEELEGVLGHELAHVKNRDILIGTIAATIAGAISMLATIARWGFIFGGMGRSDDDNGGGVIGLLIMAIVAPIAALLIRMAISRSQEFKADKDGARISVRPLALANALAKMDHYSRRIPLKANPVTAHMFIVNPLTAGGFAKLFSTHPPIPERIKRLEQLAGH